MMGLDLMMSLSGLHSLVIKVRCFASMGGQNETSVFGLREVDACVVGC